MLWGKTVPSILSGGKTEERKSMFIILLVIQLSIVQSSVSGYLLLGL